MAAVGSAYATSFNSGMQAPLANFANQGVIVNYLDLNLIGDRVQANLAAFGLVSAGACPVSCLTTTPELLSRYLFYVDKVHLTSAGFAIVGRYAVRQLEAPLHLDGQADDRPAGGEVLRRRPCSAGSTCPTPAPAQRTGGGLSFFLAGNAASADRPDRLRSLGYEMDTFGATGGRRI